MKKINIVRKSEDFNDIIKTGKSYVNNSFIINRKKNFDNIPRFGITVSKKTCNAVNRNKLKRRVKSIIDSNKNIYQNDQNYIIIIKKTALVKSYKELEQDLIALFEKSKGEKNI